MRNNLKKIQGLLKKFQGYQVSPELDKKILKAINISHAEITVKKPSFFTYLQSAFKREIKRYAVTFALVLLIFGGVVYFNQNSYAYHLNKARISLSQLDALINGKPEVTSFIGGAFADEDTSAPSTVIDEARVIYLSEDVANETEAAIDSAEHIAKPKFLQKALEEINDFQDQSVDVLSDAVEVVNSDDATESVSGLLVAATQEQALVSNAISYVAKASSDGEKEVNVDIETHREKKFPVLKKGGAPELPKKTFKFTDVMEKYKDSQKAIINLKTSGASEQDLSKLESKLSKAQTALNSGKIGRAHGLTTAIQAKSNNVIRKAEKAIKRKNIDSKPDSDNKADDKVKKPSFGGFAKPSDKAGDYQDGKMPKWNVNLNKKPSIQK